MSSTEAPFRATLPVEIAGHKILLTAGGDTFTDYSIRWAELAENIQPLLESFTLIVAAVNAAPAAHSLPAPAPSTAPSPAQGQAPPAAFTQSATPVCAHGARNPVGKVGAKGPWKAWMCPSPKGTAQCEPIWVQKNTPEWNNFPG